MKLKDVIGTCEHSKTKQSVWNPKKRKLKALNISEEDILNMDLKLVKK